MKPYSYPADVPKVARKMEEVLIVSVGPANVSLQKNTEHDPQDTPTYLCPVS